MTPGIAFALGYRDGARGVLGPAPSAREIEGHRPALLHGWGGDLVNLYANGYADGLKGDRFRLEAGATKEG